MKTNAIILLITVFILAGCGSTGADSTTGIRSKETFPTSPPPTTVSIPTTASPIPTMTVPTALQPTNPWEAEPTFSPYSLLQLLSDDTRQQILRDYCSTNTDVNPAMLCLRVFGIFGDTYAFFVDGEIYPASETIEIVGNYKFCYSSLQKLIIYHAGPFYTIQEAMTEAIITEEDLQIIFDNYYGAYPYLWAIYYEADE